MFWPPLSFRNVYNFFLAVLSLPLSLHLPVSLPLYLSECCIIEFRNEENTLGSSQSSDWWHKCIKATCMWGGSWKQVLFYFSCYMIHCQILTFLHFFFFYNSYDKCKSVSQMFVIINSVLLGLGFVLEAI